MVKQLTAMTGPQLGTKDRIDSDVGLVIDYVESCDTLHQILNFITISAWCVVTRCSKRNKKKLEVGQIPVGGGGHKQLSADRHGSLVETA